MSTKCNIPLKLKENVWKRKYGDNFIANCSCCLQTQIKNISFCCGHIFAEAKGGTLNILNLLPICKNCNQKYQIKAKSATQKEINNITTTKTFKTIGGEYSTTINNINENIDYLIILYEKHSYKIKSILYIKSDNININCIMPRKPLSLTAKRAGWQGCNLLFNNIEILM